MTAKLALIIENAVFMFMAHLGVSPTDSSTDAEKLMMVFETENGADARVEFDDLITELAEAPEEQRSESLRRACGLFAGGLLIIAKQFRRQANQESGIEIKREEDKVVVNNLSKVLVESVELCVEGVEDEELREIFSSLTEALKTGDPNVVLDELDHTIGEDDEDDYNPFRKATRKGPGGIVPEEILAHDNEELIEKIKTQMKAQGIPIEKMPETAFDKIRDVPSGTMFAIQARQHKVTGKVEMDIVVISEGDGDPFGDKQDEDYTVLEMDDDASDDDASDDDASDDDDFKLI